MNWRALDLNLLVVLDAVADERSATRAAGRLNMSQSAISHALKRLRQALGDQLFVRTPEGLEPTPYCLRIAGPIRLSLTSLRATLDREAAFDPATAERGFTVAVDNRAALVFGARLAAGVAAAAPGIVLHLRPSGTLDLATSLDRGDLDLSIGGLDAPGERFADRLLLRSGAAAIVRRGHPAGGGGSIALAALAAYPHLLLSSTGQATDFVDAELARFGLARRIALRAPLLSAPGVLAGSDMIAILDAATARAIGCLAPLDVLRLPFASPELPTAMLWHRRLDDVPAHRWLRGLVLRTARAVLPERDEKRDGSDRNPSCVHDELS